MPQPLIPVTITPNGTIVGAGPPPLVGLPAVFTFGPAGPAISTPRIVPVAAVPAQIFNVDLGQPGGIVTLRIMFKQIQVPIALEIATNKLVFQTITPCFMDVFVGGSLIIGGVICQDSNVIVRDRYLGFVGDLAFVDTASGQNQDPQINGLGTRWLLTYWPNLA